MSMFEKTGAFSPDTLTETFGRLPADPNGLDQHAPGAKCDEGKLLAAVLGDFSRSLMAVAEVGTYGANKYTRHGWEQVPDGQQRYADALWRHLLADQQHPLDSESGLRHAAHMAWNALALLELQLREREAPTVFSAEDALRAMESVRNSFREEQRAKHHNPT